MEKPNMAIKTGKRKKKKKKTGKQSAKNSKLAEPEVKDEIPEDLQSIAESSEEKLVIESKDAKTPAVIQPPAPITLSGKDKNVLRRPTRLPPHFKQRLSFGRETKPLTGSTTEGITFLPSLE